MLLATLAVLAAGIAAAQESPGPRTPEAVRQLLNAGQTAAAEALAREVLAEAQSAHGADSVPAAEAMDVLVEALGRGGKLRDPEIQRLAERAVAIKESRLGDSRSLGTSLNNLANLHFFRADYPRALALQERALGVRERALGPDHPDVGFSLNNLGSFKAVTGDYLGAVPLLERALAVWEKAYGPDHPHVASAINNLANILEETGQYARAIEAHQRALATAEKASGPDRREVALSLDNLANALKAAGDYSAARPRYEEALAIREKALGPDHAEVAVSLGNLAALLADTGDYEGARRLHERSLAIREKALGPDHPLVASTLANLGVVWKETGELAGATRLQERALAIRERALGAGHRDVGASHRLLAELQLRAGRHAEARASYERALAVLEKALGLEHPWVAEVLAGLAEVQARTGDPAGAQSRYERALLIREKALGPEHPLVAEAMLGLARTLAGAGQTARALSLALRAEEVGRTHFRLTAQSLAERAALAYAAVRPSGLGLALSLAAEGALDAPALREVWSALIRSRALVLDEMAARHSMARVADQPEDRALLREVAAARRRLANLMVRGPGTRPPEHHRRGLDEARRELERAEQALAARSAAFRQERSRSRAGLDEVAGALPPGTALVSFARYERRGPAPAAPAEASYLALAMRDSSAAPLVIPLGPAREIERRVARWRREASVVGRTAHRTARRAEAAYQAAGGALRAAVWDPVVAAAGPPGRLVLVPDGALQLVNFAALPVSGGYLAEGHTLLHLASSERDLLPEGEPARAAEGGLLIVGAPDFDARGERTAAAAAHRGAPASECAGLQGLRFEPLPAAAHEAQVVAGLWKRARPSSKELLLLTGTSASEPAFKAEAGRWSVLHLATHGFFLTGGCRPAPRSTRGVGGLVAAAAPAAAARPDNPLMLSGLVLAGANRRAALAPDEEDGILTAEEIAALDLRGVQWVVLSACDTGVGPTVSGEGVFGLRRAFQVAGARSLIMSLWPVEDAVAQRWMQALYEGRLGSGLSTAEAAREADRELLRRRRAAGLGTHPSHWAAFVAVGRAD